ncbi:uncharacterized protein FYW61_017508 isoform 2-T3 [Anableps anableps]
MAKRKRPLLKSCYVQEEVEEKSGDRKFSLRQAKRAKSFNVYGNEGDGKKKIKDDGITKENGIWFVTCENKEGIMDIEKLKRGENCIECEGRWLTPPAFEEFAGRGACKKWKCSICHEGRPLAHWFANGILSTTGYLRRGSEPMRKIIVSSRKKKSKPTKNICKFRGIKHSKYKSSSTSVTQINISSRGCIPTVGPEKQPIEDPDGSDDKVSDSNAEFLKTDQENMDGPDERNNGHSIKSGDAEDENKTDDGGVVADADYTNDHGSTEERHQDMDTAKAEKHKLKMKTKVVIRRLSGRRRRCKVKEHPKDSWCEPLEESTHNEETEDDMAVSEALKEGNVTTSDNGDKTGFSAATPHLLLPYVNKNKENRDEAKLEHDEAELETSEICIQVSDCPNGSEMVEGPPSGASEGFDVDAMDVDQLKKEKMKMQLKVLKLQEEYYMLMLSDLKK